MLFWYASCSMSLSEKLIKILKINQDPDYSRREENKDASYEPSVLDALCYQRQAKVKALQLLTMLMRKRTLRKSATAVVECKITTA